MAMAIYGMACSPRYREMSVLRHKIVCQRESENGKRNNRKHRTRKTVSVNKGNLPALSGSPETLTIMVVWQCMHG